MAVLQPGDTTLEPAVNGQGGVGREGLHEDEIGRYLQGRGRNGRTEAAAGKRRGGEGDTEKETNTHTSTHNGIALHMSERAVETKCAEESSVHCTTRAEPFVSRIAVRQTGLPGEIIPRVA
jgi:hypothetical protein